jgi:Outer membrane lipoprotein-sorting protein
MFCTVPLLLVLLNSPVQSPAVVAAPAPAAPDAVSLLRDSDRARGGLKDGITWTVEITSVEDGVTTQHAYLVKAHGDDALAEATAPPRAKGEKMLFNDRTLWFIKPGLRKPVSISARQKLSGQAANGDIASTHYARDYDAVISGEEAVNGEPSYRLELKAKTPSVTYDRIRYWISKSRRQALKAEFLTVSGEVFKSASFAYGNVVTVDGAALDFVKTMTITDAMGSGATSTLRFGAPKPQAHPASMFNVNNVVR